MDEITIVVNAEDNFSGVLGNFGNIMTGIKSTIDLVSGAIQGAADFVGQFVDSASESEQAVARLDGVLRATGGAAGLTSDELQNMANQLQGVTRFSDETILNGEAILLTFRNISGEMFERTVPAMADMAEIFGSVDSAAMQLGKALNDPLTGMGALSRAGITFSDEQKDMIKNFMEMGDIASAQNIILSEVEAQVQGLAETMGQTFSGQVAIFNNKIDSAKEAIGGVFLPILNELLGKLMEFIDSPVAQAFIGFFEDLGRYLGAGVEPLAAIGYALNNVSPAFHDLAIWFLQLQDVLRNGGNIGDLFNKIFSPENIQAAGDALLGFINSIDWNGISNKIADSISGIDWGRVGNVIAQGLGYIAIAIGTILSEIDWGALLNSMINGLLDLIGGLFGFIDWEDMWNSAMVGFSYIGNQIKGFFVNLWHDISNWWSGIDWGDIGQSIVDGLVSVFRITPIGQITFWFIDIINKIKDIFGIASPSSVFFGIARDIIQGLIDGFEFYWQGLIDLATSSLEDFLNMFGIDISLGGTSASGLGSAGGGVAGGGTGTGGTGGSGTVNNYYYGPVYFQGAGEPGAYYDCPSPNPLMTAGSGTVIPNGAV